MTRFHFDRRFAEAIPCDDGETRCGSYREAGPGLYEPQTDEERALAERAVEAGAARRLPDEEPRAERGPEPDGEVGADDA